MAGVAFGTPSYSSGVGSLAEEGLTSLFSSVVPTSLESCTLAVDPAAPYHHRGYAIVRVRDEAGAQRCQKLLNDYPVGRLVLVLWLAASGH